MRGCQVLRAGETLPDRIFGSRWLLLFGEILGIDLDASALTENIDTIVFIEKSAMHFSVFQRSLD